MVEVCSAGNVGGRGLLFPPLRRASARVPSVRPPARDRSRPSSARVAAAGAARAAQSRRRPRSTRVRGPSRRRARPTRAEPECQAREAGPAHAPELETETERRLRRSSF